MKKRFISLLAMALLATSLMYSCKKDEEDEKEEGPKCESFKDSRDNQTYAAVQIGEQCWMAENLNYATSQGSWCYDESPANCNNYGRLYSWDAANGNICPSGWRLPTDADWRKLETTLGMSSSDASSIGWRGSDEGTKLKVNGTTGFNVLMAGKKDPGNMPFGDLNTFAYFWTSTTNADVPSKAWRRTFSPSESRIFRGDFPKDYYFSVRCIKDN